MQHSLVADTNRDDESDDADAGLSSVPSRARSAKVIVQKRVKGMDRIEEGEDTDEGLSSMSGKRRSAGKFKVCSR